MGTTAIRALAAAAVTVVVVVVVVVLVGGGSSYAVTARFQDAGQLVKGNLVKVGGANVGTVDSIELADDGEAEIGIKITDDDLKPLHEGTRVVLRNSSLSSVANRVLVLEPGPNSAPKIDDGGTITAADTRSATDIDQVLNAIDVKGRQYLQTLVRGGAVAFSGAEESNQRLLERLSPALGQTRQTLEELVSDEPAFQRLIANSAAVSSTFAERSDDLQQGIQATATTLRATADEREALRRTIERGPAFLRRANSTLVSSRRLLEDARPLLRETRPVAPRLARTLRIVAPLNAATVPLLRDVRATLPALSSVLDKTPGLAEQVVPSLTETTKVFAGAKDIISDVRAYVPDILHGVSTAFGGKAGAYYDANGHYARIGVELSGDSLPELLRPVVGNLVDVISPLLGSGLAAPQQHVTNRCPGSATQSASDRSNPFTGGHLGGCAVNQVPPGGSTTVTRSAK
ncbi:MlaD family protein [Patulibacter brassicae]|uniref:MlaD family protein n=1 Tax=Patulibacter brassicae TaxID=1705717 RepID=A0ABU4VKX4_9ACTN|nr:MlaD family protein [Patulibacter brassicae]MDX8151997.1 MlaD family protein [Patulibacter brassicae]